MPYPNTEKLNDKIGAAERELATIQADATALRNDLDKLVAAFCEKHDADLKGARDYLDDLLTDLLFDAEGPAYRRKVAAENKLSVVEDRDLRANSPVVL